jgi:hypothetical protein
MAYDITEQTTPPYHVDERRLAVKSVVELRSFVDLNRGTVVSVEPMGDEQEISAGPPSDAHKAPPEAGLGATPPYAPPGDGSTSQPGAQPDVLPPPDGGGSFHAIYWNGNRQHYNWDSDGQTLDASQVDWPVTLLFSNNANVNKVKDGPLSGKYDQGASCAGPMNMRVGPNFAGMVWDTDSGKKTTCCPITGSDIHFRVYADHDDSPDRLYNVTLGYYIAATSHHDIRECGSGTQFGYSETAEQEIATDSANIAGWAVYSNYWGMDNGLVSSWIGNRYYESNGYATEVMVW